MVNGAIHRLIEQQAASHGGALAFADDSRALTYRELNCRANVLARALVAAGFRRGAVAEVRMGRSADLVVTLLAVLKAGGAYRWTCEAGSAEVCGVDVTRLLDGVCQPSPNLPVLVRGSDVACVTPDGVLVPHATVAALARHEVPRDVEWTEAAGALDVWMALMTGATVTFTAAPVSVAA